MKKFGKLGDLFNRRSASKDDYSTNSHDYSQKSSISRSKSLRLVRGEPQPAQRISTNSVGNESVPNTPLRSSFPLLSKEEKGSFVKAVNTIRTTSSSKGDGSFNTFFPENIVSKRTLFLLVQLKTLVLTPKLSTHVSKQLFKDILQEIGDRLFTLNYCLKVLEDTNLKKKEVVKEVFELIKRFELPIKVLGIREAAYSIYFILHKFKDDINVNANTFEDILSSGLKCIQSCLEREAKLSKMEQESMYIFQLAMINTELPTLSLLIENEVQELDLNFDPKFE